MSLTITLTPELPVLDLRQEPQVCYVLVRLAAGGTAGRAVRWVFVADASRSMRIPIVGDELFRELVRSGGAQEVLVDGVPVWQISGPVPPEVRDRAPSALDHVARALHSIVERLDLHDRFTLVACAEQVQVLASNAPGNDRVLLVGGIARLKSLNLGERTDLAAGLAAALDELARSHADTATDVVKRVVLLTDGFTENEASCLSLARRAAVENVAVSTIGLGGEFQDDLLMAMADASGGRAGFVHRAEDIPAAIAEEFASAREVTLPSVTLGLELPRNAGLRRATRISPELAPLEAGPGGALVIGDLGGRAPTLLLLELLAPPAPRRMLPEGVRVRLAQLRLSSAGKPVTNHDLVVTYAPHPPAPPPAVLDAANRASALNFQQRARAAITSGDLSSAARLLRAAAQRLTALGEAGMAEDARQEAAALEQTGQRSGIGAKALSYATRRLGE